jgi:hypothetical protein
MTTQRHAGAIERIDAVWPERVALTLFVGASTVTIFVSG